MDPWQCQYLVPVLELLTGAKKNCKNSDRKTRKLRTIREQRHPKAGVDRLYFPRKKGGRGLMQLEGSYAVGRKKKLVEYADKEYSPIQTVRTHQHVNSAMSQTARRLKRELKRTRQVKETVAEKTKGRWRGKRLHGQLPRNLDEKLDDKEQSYSWLKFGDIKGETVSTIVAAQDQAISTNYFKNKILKEERDSKCRLCHLHEEISYHLTSGCPFLAKNEYVMRHDKVCTHLHYSICTALGVETKDQWYRHTDTHTSHCMYRKMLQCCGIKR